MALFYQWTDNGSKQVDNIILKSDTQSADWSNENRIFVLLRPPGGSITVFSTLVEKAVLLSYAFTLLKY